LKLCLIGDESRNLGRAAARLDLNLFRSNVLRLGIEVVASPDSEGLAASPDSVVLAELVAFAQFIAHPLWGVDSLNCFGRGLSV
jgi:hypothetical protein